MLACLQRCSAHHCSIFRCRDITSHACTCFTLLDEFQVCSRRSFLWCYLKKRKIPLTGFKSHCKLDHFCLKVTARSKKCTVSSKCIAAHACNSPTNASAAMYLSSQKEGMKKALCSNCNHFAEVYLQVILAQ